MSTDRVLETARAVLEGNWREGFSERYQLDYGYTAPSLVGMKYPHQWLWDSCFHAIAWSTLEPSRAKKELITLLSRASHRGFLPHMLVWVPDSLHGTVYRRFFFGTEHSNMFTQPPVIAIALEQVYQVTGDRDFLEQTLPTTLKVYHWLARERDPDGDGLVSLINPVESGADQSPVFDPLFKISRPSTRALYWALHWNYLRCRLLRWNLREIQRYGLFNIEEIGFNAILAKALRSLFRLLEEVGDRREAEKIRLWADVAETSIMGKCFDPETGLFYSLAHRSERMIREPTYASLMPLLLEGLDKPMVDSLISNLTNEDKFWLPYPVPSVPKSSSQFDPSGQIVIWRGPAAPPVNLLLHMALKHHGYHDLAKELVSRNLRSVARYGCFEFIDPTNGVGLRTRDQSWGAAVAVHFLT
jgi:glycogen debranching enzyme